MRKFDPRKPWLLAQDTEQQDIVLEADVLSKTANVNRSAITIDGYDSDSDLHGEEDGPHPAIIASKQSAIVKARSVAPKDGDASDSSGSEFEPLPENENRGPGPQQHSESDIDYDGDLEAINIFTTEPQYSENQAELDIMKQKPEIRMMDSNLIFGQNLSSRNRQRITLFKAHGESSDSEDAELAFQEEGLDEEVGLGGLKRHAPKIEAFHLLQELEEGGFDTTGNYISKAADANAKHDSWLDGVSKRDIRLAAAAHERREAEAQRRRLLENQVQAAELLAKLIGLLQPAETPLEALARLGKSLNKIRNLRTKQRSFKRRRSSLVTNTDGVTMMHSNVDDKQHAVKETIEAITTAADGLFSRNQSDIYSQEREILMRLFRRETGCDWVDKQEPGQESGMQKAEPEPTRGTSATRLWEFWWTDGRDNGKPQGPFDGITMKAWQDAGYFAGKVEFRALGDSSSARTQVTSFDALS